MKTAPEIDFPYLKSGNNILKKSIIERVKISRLENNFEKREFAKTGLKLHKKEDVFKNLVVDKGVVMWLNGKIDCG